MLLCFAKPLCSFLGGSHRAKELAWGMGKLSFIPWSATETPSAIGHITQRLHRGLLTKIGIETLWGCWQEDKRLTIQEVLPCCDKRGHARNLDKQFQILSFFGAFPSALDVLSDFTQPALVLFTKVLEASSPNNRSSLKGCDLYNSNLHSMF